MSRLVRRKIEISHWQDGDPDEFRDGGVKHQVQSVIDQWIEMGDWWNGEGSRKLLRVLTNRGELFDLECVDQEWFIYRIWD